MTKITITLEPTDALAREWIAGWIARLLSTAHIKAINANIIITSDDEVNIEQVVR